MVCFIHRPEYYKIYKDSYGNDLRGIAELIIAKHRNGAVGDVRMRFVGQYARFMNLDQTAGFDVSDENVVMSSKLNTTAQPDAPDDSFNSLTAGDAGGYPF